MAWMARSQLRRPSLECIADRMLTWMKGKLTREAVSSFDLV